LVQKIPPQIVLLSIIAKNSNGLTLKELTSQVAILCKNNNIPSHYYSCGKGEGIVKEVLLDLNTLKILGLVEEIRGRYIVTEKGYSILGKLVNNINTLKR
jgi:ribosomal protein S19E (S16A)